MMQETLVQQGEEALAQQSLSSLRLALHSTTPRHDQMITKIRMFGQGEVYATCGRDGVVKCWDRESLSLRCELNPYNDFAAVHSMMTGAPIVEKDERVGGKSQNGPLSARNILEYPEHRRPPLQGADYPRQSLTSKPSMKSMRHSTRWATDVGFSQALNAIAVSTFDSAVVMYRYEVQVSSSSVYPCFRLETKDPVTSCFFFRHSLHGGGESDVLAHADLGGVISIESIKKRRTGHLSYDHIASKQVHTSSVTDMLSDPAGFLLSGDLEGNLAFTDGERLETVWLYKEGHQKSILALAHAPVLHISASVGLDRNLCLWDPHIGKCAFQMTLPSLPLSLSTTDAAPSGMAFNEDQNQLIVVGGGKYVRVFDIRMMKMVQCVQDTSTFYPQDLLTSCLYDDDNCCLLVAGSHMRVYASGNPDDHVHSSKSKMTRVPKLLHRLKPNMEDEEMAVAVQVPGQPTNDLEGAVKELQLAIVSLLYSPVYYRVIAIAMDGSVSVFDPTSGRRILGFSLTPEHGPVPVTAACLDHLERRLIVGDHEGKVTMWNYNSGQVIDVLEKQDAEISSLCWIKHSAVKRPIMGTSWNKHTLFWPDVGAEEGVEVVALKVNESDVVTSTVGVYQLALVATGAADGTVVLWDVHKMRPTIRITVPKDEQPSVLRARQEDRWTQRSRQRGVRANQRYTVAEQLIFVDRDRVLIVLTGEGCVHAYSVYSGAMLERAVLKVGPSPRLGIDRHSSLLLVGDISGSLHLIDAKRLKLRHYESKKSPQDKRSAVNFLSGDVTSDSDTDDSCMKLVKKWKGHDHHVTAVTFIDLMSLFATTSDEGKIILWTREGEKFGYFGQREAWPIEMVNKMKRRKAGKKEVVADMDDEDDEKPNVLSDMIMRRIASATNVQHLPTVPRPQHSLSRTILHSRSQREIKKKQEGAAVLAAERQRLPSTPKASATSKPSENKDGELVARAQERAKRVKGLLNNSLEHAHIKRMQDRQALPSDIREPFSRFIDSYIFHSALDDFKEGKLTSQQEVNRFNFPSERVVYLRKQKKETGRAGGSKSKSNDANAIDYPPSPDASHLKLRKKLQEQVLAYWRFRDDFDIKLIK
uniref:Guanine nucleotide-binding protein subunit beta-like protein n=1 Tax=Palpitomonas bilix TaxID=652834 RepID=A0A7S3G3R3_9EUKA|mmetsp:Transcript_23763/g.59975  ORF Transcript_23763/g.59975 Transcript_23763/m.59975 type:complete len:1094 (+) Transcript_23763:136-3417(+)